ncbi:MAG: ImmA/IrrE family metallo-endopeptidase [Bacteroidetes bacterium]|nr:MAG: ImmA/IrrE family metallo-endopeptidase [Bacteroidota bacterium]
MAKVFQEINISLFLFIRKMNIFNINQNIFYQDKFQVMAKKVKVNPEILKWARTSAKVSMEKAARTISKNAKIEKIKEWESSESKDSPTESQLKKLARLYRRPVDIFNLPFIPREYPKLKDFRKDKDDLGTAVVFIMREIQEKQEWLHNFYAKNRSGKLPFVGRYNIKADPELVARDIRKTLGINISLNKIKPLKYWIEKTESKRIFVTLSSNYHTRLKLNSDEFKGFAIADPFAPFIFINSEDWDHGQLFSLVHMLAHIWIGVSGISNDTGITASASDLHPVERFCNAVAFHVLLPKEDLQLFIPEKGEIQFKHIAKMGRKLGLGQRTIVIQASRHGLLQENQVKDFLKNSDEFWKEFLAKEARKPKSSGGPNYYIMQLRRNSKGFSSVVIDTYKKGKLSGADAGRLLNMREANIGKFEGYVYK